MKQVHKFDSVVIHYSEIGLKGKNRSYFEKLLMRNMKIKLGNSIKSCLRESGHITLRLDKDADFPKIKETLSKIPGIAYFSFAKQIDSNIKAMKKEVINILKDKKFSTFKIDTRRSNKNYKLKSMEINCILGEEIVKTYNKKVKMQNPRLTVKVEIADKCAYMSFEDIKGIGGLPTDQKQKIVALLSGGFDSPVAAYLMMKRGCEVILTHFHNKNQMSVSVKDKIVQLGKQLSKFQIKTKLYIIPFGDIQKEIIKKVHSKIRMLIYRRFMISIASKIAELSKAKFLVVGDSLSQVASQTLENLEATYCGSKKHILSPLIGMNKEEIIKISKQIGTHDISLLPYRDCCSYFLAKHPELRADSKLIKENESKFNVNGLVGDAVKKAKIIA